MLQHVHHVIKIFQLLFDVIIVAPVVISFVTTVLNGKYHYHIKDTVIVYGLVVLVPHHKLCKSPLYRLLVERCLSLHIMLVPQLMV